MKPLRLICSVAVPFLYFHTNSQNQVTSDDQSIKTQINTDFEPDSSIVVVNMEMIRRFREYKPDQDFVSFQDILMHYNSKSIKKTYEANYNSCFQKPAQKR